MEKFEKAMPYNIDFIIPGYEKSYPKGIFKCLALTPINSVEWYKKFLFSLESSIGKKFLPVCRLGDGEFMFCLGKKYQRNEWFINSLICQKFGKQFSIPSGVYTVEEWHALRPKYAEMLREISKVGVLAPIFTYRDTPFVQRYFIPMVRWFKDSQIELTQDNYYPFYFVYALLNGPDRGRILGKERILVVTHYDDNKAANIERNLKLEGAREIQFLQISKNRSMYNKIDLKNVRLPVDVVLVGAGIGKPNILLQLRETNTICIDAGFVIECIAYPGYRRSKNGTRTFCWADFERNENYEPI